MNLTHLQRLQDDLTGKKERMRVWGPPWNTLLSINKSEGHTFNVQGYTCWSKWVARMCGWLKWSGNVQYANCIKYFLASQHELFQVFFLQGIWPRTVHQRFLKVFVWWVQRILCTLQHILWKKGFFSIPLWSSCGIIWIDCKVNTTTRSRWALIGYSSLGGVWMICATVVMETSSGWHNIYMDLKRRQDHRVVVLIPAKNRITCCDVPAIITTLS